MINYTEYIERLCADMCAKIPELKHIDVSRIAFSIGNARAGKKAVRLASMVGLAPKLDSFAYKCGLRPQDVITPHGTIAKYMMRIYPRFHFLPIVEKLDTLVHELYHIGVNFDGQLRASGNHFKGFDDDVGSLVITYVRNNPDWSIIDWFDSNIPLDNIYCWKYPIPRSASSCKNKISCKIRKITFKTE